VSLFFRGICFPYIACRYIPSIFAANTVSLMALCSSAPPPMSVNASKFKDKASHLGKFGKILVVKQVLVKQGLVIAEKVTQKQSTLSVLLSEEFRKFLSSCTAKHFRIAVQSALTVLHKSYHTVTRGRYSKVHTVCATEIQVLAGLLRNISAKYCSSLSDSGTLTPTGGNINGPKDAHQRSSFRGISNSYSRE